MRYSTAAGTSAEATRAATQIHPPSHGQPSQVNATHTTAATPAPIAELRRLGAEPVEVMAPFAPAAERFRQASAGADWYELLLGIHVTSGMLDDYFSRLAEGLPGELATRVRAILAEDEASAGVLHDELFAAIEAEAEPGLADRLALWGRSLVGDTLLIARSALRASDSRDRGADVEPVFTELIAAHTRRMDALGLTA